MAMPRGDNHRSEIGSSSLCADKKAKSFCKETRTHAQSVVNEQRPNEGTFEQNFGPQLSVGTLRVSAANELVSAKLSLSFNFALCAFGRRSGSDSVKIKMEVTTKNTGAQRYLRLSLRESSS